MNLAVIASIIDCKADYPEGEKQPGKPQSRQANGLSKPDAAALR